MSQGLNTIYIDIYRKCYKKNEFLDNDFSQYENLFIDKDFSETLYQKSLDDAYQNNKYYKGGLKFSLGYHWSSKNQNQLVAIKK